MGSTNSVLKRVQELDLDLLDEQWNKDIWNSKFTHCPSSLPAKFLKKFSDKDELGVIFSHVARSIHNWLYRQTEITWNNPLPCWTQLCQINRRKLLSLIYFCVCDGLKNCENYTVVSLCGNAVVLYFNLLRVPGRNGIQIYNHSIFSKCLEAFTLYRHLKVLVQGNPECLNSDTRSSYFTGDGSDCINNPFIVSFWVIRQEGVVGILNDMMITLGNTIWVFSFKNNPLALCLSLQTMADITRMEESYDMEESESIDCTSPFIRHAYIIMINLCLEFHGNIPDTIKLMLYYLLPNLTYNGINQYPELSKMSPRRQTVIRNMTVNFICKFVVSKGEAAHPGLSILIHQLCYDAVENPAHRTTVVKMVLTILNSSDSNLFEETVKWIINLLKLEREYRELALTFLSKLIFKKVIENKLPFQYLRIMLGVIINRIQDEEISVKRLALRSLCDMMVRKPRKFPFSIRVLVEDIFLDPYEHLDAINFEDIKDENNFCSWESFVSFIEELSSTSNIEKLLPGGKVIFKKVFYQCFDENVGVRKIASLLIANLLNRFPKWITNETLMVLNSHCTDPAPSIRKKMIQSISKLVVTHPDRDLVIELWVQRVAPRIKDRYVRQSALEFYASLIISNIVSYENTKTEIDNLPWKILEKFRSKRKKSELKAACSQWSKCGTLNHSLITLLKTHKGTVNNDSFQFFFDCISKFYDADSDKNPDRDLDKDLDKNLNKDLDKNADKNLDKDSDEDSDENSDKDSDKDSDDILYKESDKDSNEDLDKYPNKNLDKDSDKNLYKDLDEDSDEDSDKDSDKNLDKDSDENSDKKSYENLDKDSDKDPEKDLNKYLDKNLDKNLDKDLDKDSDEDLHKDPDKNSDKDPDEDLDKDPNKDLDKNADEDLDKDPDKNPDEGLDKNLVKNLDKDSNKDLVKYQDKDQDKDLDKDIEKDSDKDLVKYQDKDQDKDSDKDLVKYLDKDSDKDIDKDPKKDLNKDPDKYSDNYADKDLVKNQDKDPKKNLDKVPDKDPEKDLYRVPDKDLDKVPDKDLDKDSEKNLDKVPDKDLVKFLDKDSDKVLNKEIDKDPEKNPDVTLQS